MGDALLSLLWADLMPPKPIPHILFSASAGSGKTYQLVRRYLQLLMLGQEPEAISAMTFTRKAAGEFFNRILRTLAELSEAKASVAREYLSELEPLPDTFPEQTELLREVSRRIHRLRLGTMDSFFAQVTTCFPLELGLPLGAKVMAEDEAKQAMVDAMEALLDRIYVEAEGGAARTLLEAFKQGTFGAEEKSVQSSLLDWIQSGHEVWLDSGGKGWGDLKALGSEVLGDAAELRPLQEIVAELRAAFPKTTPSGESMLEELEEQVVTFEPGSSPQKRVEYFVDKCHEVWDELLDGSAEVSWGRGKKIVLEGKAAAAAVSLARALLRRDLAVRAERTRGQAQVLDVYEKEYARRVRGAGRLSFGDVQRLLAAQAMEVDGWMTGLNADLWYRMDGRFDHWLLDEFQDTSAIQWSVLRGLVDEVMQDDGGERSFFAVGDPKQSIYLWRQAMPGLFGEVLSDYPHDAKEGRGLREQGLSKSWRSSKPVLDAVNLVFGDEDALESLLPGSLQGWSFEPHVPAKPDLPGGCMMLSPGPEEDDCSERVIAALLAEIDPLGRDLSCAILVRSNSEARSLTEYLRSDPRLGEMEIVCESDQYPATDNAVTLALLSLLQWSAHPEDTMAREHLRMTPLWADIVVGDSGPELTAARVRRAIDGAGFTGWLQEWLPKLSDRVALDAFHQHRLDQFAEIAAEFDAAGSRDIDAFVRFAREKPVRERGAAGAIQVMTVHAAKGLEFDMVIVTQLDGVGMSVARADALLKHREEGRIDWVLEPPTKKMARFDTVLRNAMEEQSRLQGFEALCRLYVAMTRAKSGLYLVADTAPKKGTAVNTAKLLRERLGQGDDEIELAGQPVCLEWETGNRTWYESFVGADFKPAATETPSRPEPLGPMLQELQPIARRRTPSGEESFRVTGTQLFGEGREPGRRLGSVVHLLLSRILWRDDSSGAEDLRAQWEAKGDMTPDDPVSDEAMKHVMKALESPVFEKPTSPTKVWRERSFDLIVKGEWISGIFDRVEIQMAEDGKSAAGARIIDFKTDDVSSDELLQDKIAGYRPQLKLYREAVSRLTGLPETKIKLCLLFTRTGRVETVSD